ncbi:cupin domain-containing protein [Castellaniella sp.]
MPVNFFADWPADTASESFQDLLCVPGLRIERIVSHGQASPPGFWYDQDWDEWVLVLRGEAVLRLEGEAAPRTLAPGDHCWLPRACRHRVERTAPDGPTIWLAVHHKAAPGCGA